MHTHQTRPHPGGGWKRAALWGWLLLLALSACAGGGAPTPALPPATPLPPEARITFEVSIPPDTPPEEGVNLVLLDEVTGLALNARPLPMQALDAAHYRLEAAFPLGAVLKYRYERQGSLSFPEYTADNRQVRYRLLRVVAPATVQDSVARWVDTPFTGQTGRVQGRAVEAGSGRPLPGLLVTCAGEQTFTAADGSFSLENLPVGVHWLSIYAPDGGYAPFQQQVDIAPQATTPVFTALEARPLVEVTFIVTPPDDMPAALPIRMAGNLTALGNTFADLPGGVSAPAARLPLMQSLPDGRHALILRLPAGADLRYKYTLGDGYWNAERTPEGAFRLRRLLVPERDVAIEDRIATWYDGARAYLTFDVNVPPETPAGESVAVQFSLFGWMEPLPMWRVAANHWAYFVFSPLEGVQTLHYRYCRNLQCGLLDAADTAGETHVGHTLDLSRASTPGPERVDAWQWWRGEPQMRPHAFGTTPRGEGFAAGAAFTPAWQPAWLGLYPQALERAAAMHVNWVMFSPVWRFTRSQPPRLEPQRGQTPSWDAWEALIAAAQQRGLRVALYPQPAAALSPADWWALAPRDETWWRAWFEAYRRFALHHAQMAEQRRVQTLVLGGPWVTPALPGQPDAPPDAETRWRALLDEVCARYGGEVRWALEYTPGSFAVPAFLDAVDGVYALWSPPLAEDAPPSEWRALSAQAGAYLDQDLEPLHTLLAQSVWLGVGYPSAPGALQGCVSAPEGGCLPPEALLRPPAAFQAVPVDLEAQARAIQATAFAVEHRPWVKGFFVRGTYPAGLVQGPGDSIFGKPAETLLRGIFSLWLP